MTRARNARVAGVTFLLYIAVGITQMVLGGGTRAEGTAAKIALMAQQAAQVRINILLSFVIWITAITLAVALYGLTRDEDHELAMLALCFRVGEGMLAAVGTLATLGLLWLGTAGNAAGTESLGGFLLKARGWNVTLAATLFAVGSTIFSWLLLRGRMIPLPLAWLGVVSSLLLAVALPLRLVGVVSDTVAQILWLPMAAFEIPLAFWLLIKGVAPRPSPPV